MKFQRALMAASLALWALASATPALSQASDAASAGQEESSEIIVVGETGEGARLTADSLRDAARAFIRHRPAFAPAAQLYLMVYGDAQTLRFVLRERRAGRDGVRQSRELELDSQNRLSLPLELVQTGRWELRVRGARTPPQIRPVTLSPGSQLDNRRFGDLRLQCRVAVAFARLGLATRAFVGAADPCGNSRAVIHMGTGRALSSATLDVPAQTLELTQNGMAVRMPLPDPAIGNEARVRFTYR